MGLEEKINNLDYDFLLKSERRNEKSLFYKLIGIFKEIGFQHSYSIISRLKI